MDIDINEICKILEAHKSDLGGDDSSQAKKLEQVKALLLRTDEDRREASVMAVDAAKTLVAIAVAVFVALGGFIQFAKSEGLAWSDWPILLFAGAAVSVLFSMILGLTAMSRTWKRGEGRTGAEGVAWSTTPIKRQLNLQAWTGILGLLLFGIGIVVWNSFPGGAPAVMNVSITSPPNPPSNVRGPITITGEWSKLALKPAQGPEIKMKATSAGNTDSFVLSWN